MSDSSFNLGSSDDFVEQYHEKKRRKRMQKRAYYKNKRGHHIKENSSSSDSDALTYEFPNLNSLYKNSLEVAFQFDQDESFDEKNIQENSLGDQKAADVEDEESSSDNFFTSESEVIQDSSSSFEASSELMYVLFGLNKNRLQQFNHIFLSLL
jgi:hypothetical protein